MASKSLAALRNVVFKYEGFDEGSRAVVFRDPAGRWVVDYYCVHSNDEATGLREHLENAGYTVTKRDSGSFYVSDL